MKRSLLRARIHWKKYAVEFILLAALSINVSIRFKEKVRDELFFDKRLKTNYSQYYDYVDPNFP